MWRQNAEGETLCSRELFFFLKEIQLIFSINWQQMKKKSQNKNQTNASNLNVSVCEREKPFQLLDIQENMNTHRQRKRSQLEEEEGEVHKIKAKIPFSGSHPVSWLLGRPLSLRAAGGWASLETSGRWREGPGIP